MSNGQNTQNISLAIAFLAQLLQQGVEVAATIKQAQDAGVDITDAQLDAMFSDDDDAAVQFQKDIDAARGQQVLPLGTPVASPPSAG